MERSRTLGTYSFDSQLDFLRSIPRRQQVIILGLEVAKAKYPSAAGTFKMGVLVRLSIGTGAEPPDPVFAHYSVRQAFFGQSVEHAVKSDPVQLVIIPYTLFYFVMRYSAFFRQ